MVLVSVIIPVRNRPQDIARCLESLLKLDFPKEDYEIIVVDNNSTDKTKEVIQQYPVKYVFEPKKGRGSARNRGVRESKGKYLAFIDSDCIADPHWLKELVKALDGNPHVAALGGKVTPLKTDRLIEKYFVSNFKLEQEQAILSAELGFGLPRLITANAIIRKDMLEKVGNFDRRFITHEDTDISWRLILHGLQIQYIPAAIVYHKHLTNIFSFIRHQFEFGWASYVIYKKYDRVLFVCFSSHVKFLLRRISRLLLLPRIFFTRRKGYKEQRNSLALLTVISVMIVTSGEILAFILHWLRLVRSVSPMDGREMDSLLHRSLSISLDGFKFSPSPEVIWFTRDDLTIFLNIIDRSFYKLNETSTRIWQVLCETQNFSSAVNMISREYRMPEEAVFQDARELFKQLENEKLITKNAS